MLDFIRRTVSLAWFAIVTIILMVFAALNGAPIHQVSIQGAVQMDITALLAMLLSLTGFGAFVTFLVNALKALGYVKDDTATTWVTGLNLIGLVGLFLLNLFHPDWIKPADTVLAALTQVGMIVVGLLWPNAISRFAYVLFRGVPVVGTSFSLRNAKVAAIAARAAQAKVSEAPGTAKR